MQKAHLRTAPLADPVDRWARFREARKADRTYISAPDVTMVSEFWTNSPRPPWSAHEGKGTEARFVCYGGVSLVLYMHGVIKEILKLSRASKAYHSVPQSEQREHRSYEAADGDDGDS